MPFLLRHPLYKVGGDMEDRANQSFVRHRPHCGPFENFNELTTFEINGRGATLLVTYDGNDLLICMSDGTPCTLCQWGACLYINYCTRFEEYETFGKILLWPALAHAHRSDEALRFVNRYADPAFQDQARDRSTATIIPSSHQHPTGWHWIWPSKLSLWYAPEDWYHLFRDMPHDQGTYLLKRHEDRVGELVVSALLNDAIITEEEAQVWRKYGAWPTKDFPKRCKAMATEHRVDLEAQMIREREVVLEWGIQGQQAMREACLATKEVMRREDEGRLQAAPEWRVPLSSTIKLFYNCHRGTRIEFRNASLSTWHLYNRAIPPGQSYTSEATSK